MQTPIRCLTAGLIVSVALAATTFSGCAGKSRTPSTAQSNSKSSSTPVQKTPGASAATNSPPPDASAKASPVQVMMDSFLDGYFAWRPSLAVGLGLHKFDGGLTDYGRSSVGAELARLRTFEKRFEQQLAGETTIEDKHDLRLLLSLIRIEILKLEENMDGSPYNPMTYAGALDANLYLKRNYAPLETRVEAIIRMLGRAPALFASARANLPVAIPRPHLETAITIAEGGAAFLKRDLPEAVKELKSPRLMDRLNAASMAAQKELTAYVAWLKKERMDTAHQHFALGREKYVRMLQADLVEMDPEQLLQLGYSQLKLEQARFDETARKIDPKLKPIQVFKEIQKDHPTAAKLIEETRQNLEAIRQFVVDRKLVTIPSEVRVRVEETPRYARATSFASMDTPGPFEKGATEAYYYVTPVEPEWPAAQQEEWLTAFNRYTTDVVSIHEAYPGHYTQFLWVNHAKLSRVRRVVVNYAFSEGWAHYTEQMLVDEGFGKDETPGASELRGLKYKLAQSDEALLRLCRLCVSIQMHCNGMTLEEAARFFEQHCHYEPKPAMQEAIRGTFDPGYLYYTVGKLQILKLRRDYSLQEGAGFSLREFHDAVLRHGSPPVRLLRERLLKDPALWEKTL